MQLSRVRLIKEEGKKEEGKTRRRICYNEKVVVSYKPNLAVC